MSKWTTTGATQTGIQPLSPAQLQQVSGGRGASAAGFMLTEGNVRTNGFLLTERAVKPAGFMLTEGFILAE